MNALRSTGQAGITLIETLFAVAIIAVLASFANSSYSAAINATRTGSGLASLVAALLRARNNAEISGFDVVLCPSSDGAACSAGDHWEAGWIGFAAAHGGSERKPGDPIVLRQDALPPKVHLVSTSGRTRIHFQPNGNNAGSNVTFTFCDGRGPTKAIAYAMGNNGSLHKTALEPVNVAAACAAL
jgi:type IV fimbrial biogenesis protein FimT